jgi:hypothetical protein
MREQPSGGQGAGSLRAAAGLPTVAAKPELATATRESM